MTIKSWMADFLERMKRINNMEVYAMIKETKPRTTSGKAGQKSLREIIEKKAYEIYEQRGREPGKELEDWHEAEKIIKRKKR